MMNSYKERIDLLVSHHENELDPFSDDEKRAIISYFNQLNEGNQFFKPIPLDCQDVRIASMRRKGKAFLIAGKVRLP